jgi:tRNA threonylcarbamoyl adenosine modification protein YeaZ
MNLTLVIDSASKPFNVVVCEGKDVLCDLSNRESIDNENDIVGLTRQALVSLDLTFQSISQVAVNVGPGSLSSVRTGVSFANAFAYSTAIPVCPVTSFELIGAALSKEYKTPVITSLRAAQGHAYFCLFKDGTTDCMRYGLFGDLAKKMVDGTGEFVVAGHHRKQLIELANGKIVHDSGIRRSQAKYFVDWAHSGADRSLIFPDVALPITEESEVFYE